jgi:cobalamin synthase
MPYIVSHRTQQRLAVAGLMTCLIALSAELTVHMAEHTARGGHVVGALLSYVSYYTVGSNILLVAVYAAHLSRSRALRILRDTRVRTMAAAMITLVMLVYLFVLSRVEAPQGLGKAVPSWRTILRPRSIWRGGLRLRIATGSASVTCHL